LELESFGKQLAASIAFVANIFFFTGYGYFADDSALQPLHHTWSLAVEEQFYLLFPIAFISLLRMKQSVVLLFLYSGMVISFAISVIWMAMGDKEAAFYLLPARGWELLLGALMATDGVPDFKSKATREFSAFLGLAAILVAAGAFNRNVPFPGWSALVPCVGCALIIHAGKARDTLVYRVLASSGVVVVGLASYSIYIWHMPIIVLHKLDFDIYLSDFERIYLLLGSIGVGFLSWRYIELPVRFGGAFRTRRSLFWASFGAFAICAVVAISFIAGKGLDDRFPPEIRALAAWRNSPSPELADGACFITRDRSTRGADIDPQCLMPDTSKKNYLLVGDSFAARLWGGWQATLPGVNLMQATASGCVPLLHDDGAPRCRRVVDYVYDTYLPTSHIDAVVLFARWGRGDVDKLADTVKFIRRFARDVIVLGPMPTYRDNLPRLLLRATLRKDPSLIDRNRNSESFELDEAFGHAAASQNATYISMVKLLCDEKRSCVTRAPDGEPLQFDYGHVTFAGSQFIAARILEGSLLPSQ
jgi:peptidoglycan/LPS O-acetylase OafA/YrhL